MAGHSLNHIVLSSQELIALNKIIIMGCDAFKILEYPLTYKYFIASIYHVIEFSSIGVTLATPSADLKTFSDNIDVLASFIRNVRDRAVE
jgi:hypothetical protein